MVTGSRPWLRKSVLSGEVGRSSIGSEVEGPVVLPHDTGGRIDEVRRPDVSPFKVEHWTVGQRPRESSTLPNSSQRHLARRPRILVCSVSPLPRLLDAGVAGMPVDPRADLFDRHEVVVGRHVEDDGRGRRMRGVSHGERHGTWVAGDPEPVDHHDLPGIPPLVAQKQALLRSDETARHRDRDRSWRASIRAETREPSRVLPRKRSPARHRAVPLRQQDPGLDDPLLGRLGDGGRDVPTTTRSPPVATGRLPLGRPASARRIDAHR